MRTSFRVNEVFRSKQGEGYRAGSENVFVRFTGCNLRCAKEAGPRSPGGFDCDTEFMSGLWMATHELLTAIERTAIGSNKAVILTGGEPMLQVDAQLVDTLHRLGFYVAIETNGAFPVPANVDWITVSPKVAEHCIRQRTASEVKYVRHLGQALPVTCVKAEHYFLSPGFEGNEVDIQTLEYVRDLAVRNPPWQLSVQQHKFWGIR